MVFRRWEKSKQPESELTLARLKSVLKYNPATGRFTYTGNRPKTVKGEFAHRKGHPEKYINLMIDGKCYPAHRLAWFYVHGRWPEGFIDHINRQKNDNRIGNLRVATASQNLANARVNTFSKTGVKGVTVKDGKFIAKIKSRTIGSYATLSEAADAYALAAKHEFGEFAFADREPEIKRYNHRRPRKNPGVKPVAISPMSKLLGITNEK